MRLDLRALTLLVLLMCSGLGCAREHKTWCRSDIIKIGCLADGTLAKFSTCSDHCPGWSQGEKTTAACSKEGDDRFVICPCDGSPC